MNIMLKKFKKKFNSCNKKLPSSVIFVFFSIVNKPVYGKVDTKKKDENADKFLLNKL